MTSTQQLGTNVAPGGLMTDVFIVSRDRTGDGQGRKLLTCKIFFEDTIGVTRSLKSSKVRHYNGKKKTKSQAMVGKTLQRKPKIGQH